MPFVTIPSFYLLRIQAEYFPAFENADHTFRIAFFSATPTEIEAFQKGNEA